MCDPVTKRHGHFLLKAWLMRFCTGIYDCLCGLGFQKITFIPTLGQALGGPGPHERVKTPKAVSSGGRPSPNHVLEMPPYASKVPNGELGLPIP